MIGQIISSIGEGITANRMAKEQKKALKNLKESDYIAPGLLQAAAGAEKRANASRYEGQDIDEANIKQASATAFNNTAKATTSSTNLLNSAMGIQAAENKAMDNVSSTLQQFKRGNQKDFNNLLLDKADAQLGNRRQYEATKSSLQGAIMQNKAKRNNAWWNAAGGIADTATSFATGGMKSGGGFDAKAGLSSMGGSGIDPALLAKIAAMSCWVAREVFGSDDIRWILFREWLLQDAPLWFRAVYLKHGESFARWIANKPVLKKIIFVWMSARIRNKFQTA